MVNFGDILRDQVGDVMDRGQGCQFLVLDEVEDGKIKVVEIGVDKSSPLGPVTIHDEEKLSELKRDDNLYRLLSV